MDIITSLLLIILIIGFGYFIFLYSKIFNNLKQNIEKMKKLSETNAKMIEQEQNKISNYIIELQKSDDLHDKIAKKIT